MPIKSTESDFWGKFKKQPDGCWEFFGCKSSDGYGLLTFQGRPEKAHRLSYKLAVGEIPIGMVVCHKCDNPPCGNPDHLFIGTQSDNIADRVSKGHEADHKGVKNGRAKLNDSEILRIRNSHDRGEHTKKELADKYGVSDVLIGMIVKRKIWRHV